MVVARMEETYTVIWTIGVRDEVGRSKFSVPERAGNSSRRWGTRSFNRCREGGGREESVNSYQTVLITHCYALKASRPARLSLWLCVEGVEMQMKFSRTKLFLFRLSASCDLGVIHVSTRNRID